MWSASRPPSRARLRGSLLAALLLSAGAGAAACAGTSDADVFTGTGLTTTTAPGPATTGVPQTTIVPPGRGQGQPVTIAFGGDIHYDGTLATTLQQAPDTMLAGVG